MRVIAAFILVLALVPAALATTLRERQAAGPLSAVSIAGTEVAYADEFRQGCHEIRLWDTATRGDRRLSQHCFVATSTGSGVDSVSVAGGRALWLTYIGGNIREWSLWTKGTGSRVKRIAFLSADVDGPPPVVLGRVWDNALPYAIGRTVIVLAPNGSRRFTLTAPDRVVALSAHTRGYAAVLANGHVLEISLQGNVLRDRTFEPGFASDAVYAAPGLLVMTKDGLEIWNGQAVRRFPLPKGSRFLGYSDGIAAYGTGRELRLTRLSNGADKRFRMLQSGFEAQLGRRGLAFASGQTLGFSAWVIVAGSV